MAREPRYRWLGALPHGRALAWMARSHALVVSSLMEGGANVIAEAARVGTPVLASRVSGNVGMLGRRYPGYYPVRDQSALAALLVRAASDGKFLGRLQRALRERRHLFAPAAERRSLAVVLDEALERSSSPTLARTALLDQSSSP
jgi:glycosyltransferase involved in cell wall biosynthesis